MALILDGRKVCDEIAEKFKAKIVRHRMSNNLGPALAIIQVGNNPASEAYIKQKKIFGEKIGARVEYYHLPENVNEAEATTLIEKLNNDKKVHGIILQLPLPSHLTSERLIDKIDPRKDVDGLTATNIKKLFTGTNKPSGSIMPATARGVLTLLSYYKIPIAGKKAVVVGRSSLVGKPIALALLNRGATVTVCHRGTADLATETKRVDILIAAAGAPGLITAQHVTPDQIVIDVGISRVAAKLVGDVDFAAVEPIAAAISPVPGGVGPLTVASLFANLLDQFFSSTMAGNVGETQKFSRRSH